MTGIPTLERVLWAVGLLLNAGLLWLGLYRKNLRVFPSFFLYALLNFLQDIVLFASYRHWGFNSLVSFKIAWGSQSLVVAARTLAVVEICRHSLAKYRGIWALGWRLFLATAILVLAYSWAIGGHRWMLIALTADRGLEMAVAAALFALFLFTRYYVVSVGPTVRLLGIGFFLYSCFRILNDTVLERWLTSYVTLWNLFGTLASLAGLVLWTWALRHTQPATTPALELLPEDHYRSLSPEINARLKALNDQLSYFWHAEGKKT